MPASSATASFIASKLFPPLMGLVGALVTLSYMKELSKRQWGVALTIGVFGAYLITPIVSSYLKHTAGMDWLPQDGSVEGLIGLLIGMMGIHAVGGATYLGKKFSENPLSLLDRIRSGGNKNG